MKVRDTMTTDVKSVFRDSTLEDAVRIMRDADCGAVPVVESSDDKRLCGVVTDRDCALHAFEKHRRLDEIPVEGVMSRELVTCKPDDPLESAERLMAETQVRRLPVVDEDGRLQGIVATADLAREGAKDFRQQAQVGATMSGISQPAE